MLLLQKRPCNTNLQIKYNFPCNLKVESGEPPSQHFGEYSARGKEGDIRESGESSFSGFCERAFSREILERLILTDPPPHCKEFLLLFALLSGKRRSASQKSRAG